MKLIFLLLLLSRPSFSKDYNKLADAIRLAENSRKFEYGISYVTNGVRKGYPEPVARHIALGTLTNCHTKWIASGMTNSYLQFTSKVYCPLNSKVWERNVSHFLAKR